jgi:hypothetical protein
MMPTTPTGCLIASRLYWELRDIYLDGSSPDRLGNRQRGAMAYENLGTPWIEIVERYIDALIHLSIATGELPNPVIPWTGSSRPARACHEQ